MRKGKWESTKYETYEDAEQKNNEGERKAQQQ